MLGRLTGKGGHSERDSLSLAIVTLTISGYLIEALDWRSRGEEAQEAGIRLAGHSLTNQVMESMRRRHWDGVVKESEQT